MECQHLRLVASWCFTHRIPWTRRSHPLLAASLDTGKTHHVLGEWGVILLSFFHVLCCMKCFIKFRCIYFYPILIKFCTICRACDWVSFLIMADHFWHNGCTTKLRCLRVEWSEMYLEMTVIWAPPVGPCLIPFSQSRSSPS